MSKTGMNGDVEFQRVEEYGMLAEKDSNAQNEWAWLAGILGIFQVGMVVLFALFVRYPATDAFDDIQNLFYLDVPVMMLVGFGFLTTLPICPSAHPPSRSQALSPVEFGLRGRL